MTRTLLAPLALLTLGCSGMDADPTLRTFEDCDQMERYMKDMALEEARYWWSFDFRGGGVFMANEMDLATAEDGESGASSYSTTNIQEQGVDEDDLMKTDGEMLYTLAGGYLVASRAWPIEDAAELGRVAIDGIPRGLYLLDDGVTVVVLSDHYEWYSDQPSPRSGDVPSRTGDYTQVTIIDVSDLAEPVVLRETYATGSFKESRRIGDRLFVVSHEDIDVDAGSGNLRESRKAIKKTSLGSWLPIIHDNVRQDADWSVDETRACDCTDVWYSDRLGGTELTHVNSLDLSDPDASFVGTAVTGRADTVYASPTAIYLGIMEYDEGGPFPSKDSELDTVIHKFDLGQAGSKPVYAATGVLEGTLSDQFALSERNGILRVATTVKPEPWDTSTWSSSVFTLEDDAEGHFVELDSAHDLAPGEEIFAARFTGRLGYLVTYEVILGDPLFTIDLSDPEDIDVAGELPVTGFSDYIHPMDENHLLTVGMDDGGDGGQWGLAVSIFDVTDLEEPFLQDRLIVDAWGSEAQSEHHAFNYFAEKDALAIPSWSYDGAGVLEVFEANVETGLSHTGSVVQEAVLAQTTYSYCANVRRSVIMEDSIWAISSAGLTATPLDAPSDEIAAVPFVGIDPCVDQAW